MKSLALLLTVFVAGVSFAAESAAQPDQASYRTMSLRGRVVWASDALSRRHGIKQVPEASDRVMVVETEGGELYPLAEDIRGRAFRRDARLRDLPMELEVRKYSGSPFVQVIRVFELAKDGKYEIDYWCEICSIAMFELKECDCCQGPIELRKQKVTEPAN